jgi:teichoic acid glycerol-phosphate primase
VKLVGLIEGPFEHHLDHLAIFCSLMEIPLALTDEDLLEKARLYYPGLEILFFTPLEAPFEITRLFDVVFYCTPRLMFDKSFLIGEITLQKKLRTVWLPHGNSDKGHDTYFMEALKDEELALVYGPKMLDFMQRKNVSVPSVQVGNFRLEYYRRRQSFYDGLIDRLNLPSGPKILYAPTWNDTENSSSFFQAFASLAAILPHDHFLLVKLHPNLEKEILSQQLALQYESHPRIRFLKGFTPIYPLLAATDIYLGDMSSIGYDFLTFNRPMFFLNPHQKKATDPSLYLHRCGKTIDPPDYASVFTMMDHEGAQSHLTAERAAAYAYTFGPDRPWDLIRQEILETLKR